MFGDLEQGAAAWGYPCQSTQYLDICEKFNPLPNAIADLPDLLTVLAYPH